MDRGFEEHNPGEPGRRKNQNRDSKKGRNRSLERENENDYQRNGNMDLCLVIHNFLRFFTCSVDVKIESALVEWTLYEINSSVIAR